MTVAVSPSATAPRFAVTVVPASDHVSEHMRLRWYASHHSTILILRKLTSTATASATAAHATPVLVNAP